MSQLTDTLLMVRPVKFKMNEQTAVNNFFQTRLSTSDEEVNLRAQKEFDGFVEALSQAGVRVVVVEDTPEPPTPDSIFPNNWISFHADGRVALYPMFAENRRWERREEILEELEKKGFRIAEIIDYTSAEEEGVFLEGTGSMVLDRVNHKAYCALSARAEEDLLIEFCEDFEYTPVVFHAYQTVNGQRMPIYHTNVMMALGEKFAVACLDCIDNKSERKNFIEHLKSDGKEIIAITEAQMHSFAGNMLLVKNTRGEAITVMSESAYQCLNDAQRERLEKHGRLLYAPLQTIETCGGGSARCMMAEVFLPKTD